MFWLGGQYWECSLVDLAWMISLYEQHIALSPFDMFLWVVTIDYSNGVNNYGFQSTITNDNYNLGISQKRQIRSPIHNLIHRIVTFRINHKKYVDKVTSLSLFYLCSIMASRIFFNIPYFLAKFLGENAVNSRPGSLITGGHFVTRLAKSYGVFNPKYGLCIDMHCGQRSYHELLRVNEGGGKHMGNLWNNPKWQQGNTN